METLQFFWQEFGKDHTFTNCNAQGQEALGFYLMIKQYNIKNISLASVLGFNEPSIVTILQNTVHKVFSHRFSGKNLNFQSPPSTSKEETLVRSLKRKSHELEQLCENDSSSLESWKNLGLLKRNWPMVPIMLLTATCTYKDAQDIRTSLEIPSENFAMIRGSSFERKEITIEVYKRRDNRETFSNDLVSLIEKHERGRIIIYCATQSGCDDLFAMLQPLLPDKNLGEQRQSIISHWKDGKTQIMIGTNAFGMGINSSDVVHCVAPLNMTNLIQEIGRAERDGNEAKSMIFYSIKKDLRTNFGILAENRYYRLKKQDYFN